MRSSKANCLVLAAVACAACAGHAPPESHASTATVCPASVPFPSGVELIKAIRVYRAEGGESAFETVQLTGETKAFFKPGEVFAHNLLAQAAKVQIVSGPANVVLPNHAPAGKEMFLTIQGSSTLMLPNGQERAVTPGTLVIFDDGGSKTGHGGRTGPCGYVAIDIAFP